MNNFLLINKEQGISSFDVIRKLKKKYDHKHFGHTGTLDPLATGLLVVANGKEALKAIRFANGENKEYVATLKLGSQTDTGDSTGKVIKTQKINVVKNPKTILKSFLGQQIQLPPKFSAKKIKGRKAYDLARQGKQFELKPIDINVLEIELIAVKGDEITFRTLVSKGTFIRVLCEDIAKATNNLAHMNKLIRTKVGQLKLEDASSIKEIKEKSILPISKIINLNKIKINKEQFNKIKLGQRFFLKGKGQYALIYKDKLTTVVEIKDEKMSIVRNFNLSK